MPVVKFTKEKKEIEVPVGANLRTEAKKAGINVNCAVSGVSEGIDRMTHSLSRFFNCHGFGLCGTCRVLVTKGMENTNDMSLREKLRLKYSLPVPDPLPSLAYYANPETLRLACLTKVNGDIEVDSNPPDNLFGDNFFS